MTGCLYCGDRCVEHFVYVIGERDDPSSVKVGYTKKLTKRLAQIRKATGRNVAVLGSEMVECEFKAMDVESHAHESLRQYWTGRGEWFACDPGMAREHLRAAILFHGWEATKP